MANIYFLNQTPHSFWDLVADLGDQYAFHPYGRPPSYTAREGGNQPNAPNQEQTGGQTEAPKPDAQPGPSSEKERPEPENRGLGENDKEKGPENPPQDLPFRGRGGRTCHGGRAGKCGPGACRGPQQGRGCGPDARFRRHHPCGPGAHPFWGRRAFQGAGRGGAPFDLPAFLENLGSNLGINLTDILNNARSGTPRDVDFTPRADIFDMPTHYVVHVSLPGAKKSDISIDYDPENSALRLAGVVYRPGVDEALNAALVVDGRSREVGVFERQIHLGTRTKPANVDANRISAKLNDGVLVIELPKVEVDEAAGRKKVPIESVDEKNKGKEAEKEAEAEAMHVESETEAGDEVMVDDKDDTAYHPASVEEEDADEKEYITVDVD